MPIKTSPDSAITASNQHAVIPSSVASNDTLADESNAQASAVTSGNNPDHFPFMKLAVGKSLVSAQMIVTYG